MSKALLKLISDFKRDRRLLSYDEAAIKQAVVFRILRCLGWDYFNIDEVRPEYSIGNGRVDYALRFNGKNKVFIEVKSVNEDLEKHQEQLLSYSFQEGVKLAVLTNGISWWFYLPLREGSWEQRKFYTIEIYDQNTEDIVEKFEEFLLRENVVSDRAIKNAESLYKSRQKLYLIKETLPKTWRKIIMEPDELLVELLADTTEKLCGYKPDNEMVEQFLLKIGQGTEMQPGVFSGGYTGRKIVAFAFKGTRYNVRSWKEMLIKIANLMLSAHREQFGKVLNLVGRKRPYFAKNPNKLRSPKRISNTEIYVETNLSAESIFKLSKRIIMLFGYREDDISVEVE